jgi:hypothetical protein
MHYIHGIGVRMARREDIEKIVPSNKTNIHVYKIRAMKCVSEVSCEETESSGLVYLHAGIKDY